MSEPIDAFTAAIRKFAMSRNPAVIVGTLVHDMEAVRVIYHEESTGWWAESPDIPGWSAAAEGEAEVERLAAEGVRFALDSQPDVQIEERKVNRPAR